MNPERYQKKVAMAQAASAANAEKDASKSPTPAAVSNTDGDGTQEDNSEQYRYRLQINVPPGKLGMTLVRKSTGQRLGLTVVGGCKKDSPLSGIIPPGSRLMAVDFDDTSCLSPSEITAIMSRKSECDRLLTFASISTFPTTASAEAKRQEGYRKMLASATVSAEAKRGPMAAKMALYKQRRDAEKSASMASAPKKNFEGKKKDVSPDIPDDDENMPTLDDEELAAAISLGFGNTEVNTNSVAESALASPTIQLYNQRIAEKYRKKNLEGKKKDAEKLETGNDVAAALAASVASASDENGPLYTMNQTRHEEYLRKDEVKDTNQKERSLIPHDIEEGNRKKPTSVEAFVLSPPAFAAQADNIVAIGKNVTPDGGDGDKKMPALDDEEIAKAISASENNMLDRLLEKEMDGDEEMQEFKSRHLLPASVAHSMSVDNAIHRWLQGKTVRQMAANDSQDGSRKMLPASTAQGEASASMASASPSREDDQIRKESHDGDNRKFPAPSDVASAAEAHKLTAGQMVSKNSSLDVTEDAVKLSVLDDRELALAISASVGNSPVAQKRETKIKIPGERESVIDQIMEEDEEFQVFKRQFHSENYPQLMTQEMMIQKAAKANSASVGNSSAETNIERNIIDQMASAAGQASSTAPSAENIPENVLRTSDAARSSIAPNNPQTRPAGATVVRNPLNTQASERQTLFVMDAELVRPPSLDDPLGDALKVIDELSSTYLELGPATVPLSMLQNTLAAAVACCDDAIDVQPAKPPLVEDAPLGDALKFLAPVSGLYREFGIERMSIHDVREALVKAMVRCENERNSLPVNVKINARPQGKKFSFVSSLSA